MNRYENVKKTQIWAAEQAATKQNVTATVIIYAFYLLTYSLNYLLTYSLYGAQSFLRN
jgi:hypothetical protein